MLKKLYPFQETMVQDILQAPGKRWILNAEMGVGKTPATITAMMIEDVQTALIVCPAMVRENWLRELDTWWPAHPTAKTVTVGADRLKGLTKDQKREQYAALKAPIQIVSYELLGDLLQHGTSLWDAVVIDELHRCKNPMTEASKNVKLVTHNPSFSMLVGLTGTLMPDQITDVWNQLDIFWEGRFGKAQKNGKASWSFCNRYANTESNKYGSKFVGSNELHIDELSFRLSQVSTRVTRQEVAHLLPALNVSLLMVQPKSKALWQQKADKVFFERVGQQKTTAAVEWLESQFANGVTHPVVLTHLRDTAATISAQAAKIFKIPSVLIDGSVANKQRLDMIEEAKLQSKAVIVATMHSIEEGINNLAAFHRVLFAELYWRPKTMLQAMMRFPRINSDKTQPVSIDFLVLQNSCEERMVYDLQRKIAAINQAIKSGQSEDSLLLGLSGPEKSDAEVFSELNNSLNLYIEEDL